MRSRPVLLAVVLSVVAFVAAAGIAVASTLPDEHAEDAKLDKLHATRPIAACGMKFRFAPPPWNAATGLSARRRPFISTSVREAPKPRRLIVAVPPPPL